jgi:hypothetical protein
MSKRGSSKRRMPETKLALCVHARSPIPLISLSELPDWYSITCNPFVHSGYRLPASTFLQSANSIFEWHNETLNIHTHLWPGLYFFLYFCVRCPTQPLLFKLSLRLFKLSLRLFKLSRFTPAPTQLLRIDSPCGNKQILGRRLLQCSCCRPFFLWELRAWA